MPVMLYHKDAPDESIMVYALLDDQSNSTFIAQQTMDKLKATGQPVKIKLATMLAEETINSEVVHGLSVCNVSEGTPILLPGAYFRESIPTNRSLIPRPKTVMQWHHLASVAEQLLPYVDNVEIGLDCPRAIKPRELIPGAGDDPWAVSMSRGWGIAGIVDPSHSQLVSVANDKPCHLAFRTHVTEISPLTVCNMFDFDFNERKSEERVSVEDRRFLDKLSDGIHRRSDGHFETPLPFKDNVKLPNNRAVTLKRLSRMKSTFPRDSQYREDYSRFMAEIITHVYAEPVPAEELTIAEGRTWYIPHHGLYHPKKAGKIRVVCDCSAEYMCEVLNRHLLQGPDLTNNLTGVLCRFRQEPLAVSCDIESMYHLVGVNRRTETSCVSYGGTTAIWTVNQSSFG